MLLKLLMVGARADDLGVTILSGEPRPPECVLAGDGAHFWWKHECYVQWRADEEPELVWIETSLPYGPGTWTVVQEEPLTISPSIWCQRCDTHGFFENGSWRPI